MEFERPTTETVLPITGFKAIVYTYFLRGDREAIERIMLESAEFERDPVTGKSELKKVDATYRNKMEDKAVLLAVKSLVDKEGKDLVLTDELIKQLPEDDFGVIYKIVDELGKKKVEPTTTP